MNAFADDNRVVHDDTEHEHEREQRHHVDRYRRRWDHEDRTEERNRDTDADPDRDDWAQEQGQQYEHEHEANRATVDQHVRAAPENLRTVQPDLEFHARRQRSASVLGVIAHSLVDRDHIRIVAHADNDRGRSAPVEPTQFIRLFEAVADISHIAEQHARAVRISDQHDIREICGDIGLLESAQRNITALGTNRATRQVDRRTADRIDDVIERQVVLAQCVFRHLDCHLGLAQPFDINLVHARKARNVVAHAVGNVAQRGLVGIGADDELDDFLAPWRLLDLRFLGLIRQGIERVHTRLDIAEHFLRVETPGHFDRDAAAPVDGLGSDRLDAFQVVNGFFDGDADAFFDLGRACSGVFDVDIDHIEWNARHDFAIEQRQ